jgi:hypothetical protein
MIGTRSVKDGCITTQDAPIILVLNPATAYGWLALTDIGRAYLLLISFRSLRTLIYTCSE